MCHILCGMKFETDEEKECFRQFRDDFELTEKALFAPSIISKEFIEGFEARNRICEDLNVRFDKIYRRTTLHLLLMAMKRQERKKNQPRSEVQWFC